MKTRIVPDGKSDVIQVGSLFNSTSVGFIDSKGMSKGFIARTDYDEYKAVNINSSTYFSAVSPTKEGASRQLMDVNYQLFMFSNDDELKAWLLD